MKPRKKRKHAASPSKEAVKRDLYASKETYMRQKRPSAEAGPDGSALVHFLYKVSLSQ